VPLDLNPLAVSAARLLRAIDAGTADCNAELARQADRPPANIARDLGRLVEGGLITADAPPRLTAEGAAQLAAITRAEGEDAAGPGVTHDQILPDPDNARRDWESEDAVADLSNLAEDIRANGLLQNLVVRAHPDPGDRRFILVGGERRWRAIGLLIAAGHWRADQPIPVRLLDHDDDVAVRLAALAENLQRRDLNPIEEATAFRALKDLGLATQDIADRVGKTQRHVQMRLQLLECLSPEDQRRMTLPEGDAKRLSVSEARKLVQAAEAARKARDAAEVDYTDRQRLILTEMRLARDAAAPYGPVQVDPDAMVADADAEALDKAGLIDIPTSWDLDGRAMARIEWEAAKVLGALGIGYASTLEEMAAIHAYADTLRERLGLPARGPTDGQWSTPWLNGPFELPPQAAEQIAAIKAENEARAARFEQERRERAEARQRRAERVSTARAQIDGLLAHAPAPPAEATVVGMTAAAEGLDLPLPWRATDQAEVLAANDVMVVDCNSVAWGGADEGDEARALMIAMAANTAAGLATPPLQITAEADQTIDGSDPEAGEHDHDEAAGADDEGGDDQ
jgi:ParB/RepB/Spo0J family partition protein